MRRETELLFETLIREDRSVLELLTADWTFVNERLARHYGIPNVTGEYFRRVQLADENRRGLLGHGSILMMTSVADRTSPVLRGKWVMEVLLGSPPPPPPANVPALEETSGVADARLLSVRERMEEHRKNPACTSCHKRDRSARSRAGELRRDRRVAHQGQRRADRPVRHLYDGTRDERSHRPAPGAAEASDVVISSFTESLMTYALGRRIEHYDMPAVRAIVRDAAKQQHRMSAFILGVVEQPGVSDEPG